MSRSAELTGSADLAPSAQEAIQARPPPRLLLPRAVRPDGEAGFAGAVRSALDSRRVFILLPFATIVGLIVYVSGALVPSGEVLGFVVALLGLLLVSFRHSLGAVRLISLVAAVWLGVSLLPLHGALFGTEMLAYPSYGSYEAHIDEVLAEAEDGRRVVVSSITPVDDARHLPVRRARIVLAPEAQVAPGDRIRAAIRFYPVPGPVVPGGFDTQFHAYFDGIGAYGAAIGSVERISAGEGTLGRLVDGVRRGMGERIDRSMSGPALGIARSMMIGDQSRISDETREIMAECGLAHIYSISGLHLSIVAGGALLVIRLLLAPFPRLGQYGSSKKVAAIAAIGVAFAYLLLAGGASNVPAFRSTIMIALVFGAVLAGRRALTMRNVAIAGMIVIATDPASVFRPSFQLSFAAVVALVGIYEIIRSDPERRSGPAAWTMRVILATALTSLIAGAATLPFSAYHFQQTAPLGILANVMSLLLIMPIMAAIVLAALAMPFGVEAPFLAMLQTSTDALLWIAATVTEWSVGLTLHPLLTPLALLLTFLALAWFAFLPSWHRLIAPALLLPAVLLFGLDRPPDVLVSDTTQALAVRQDEGLALVAGRSDSFAVNVWRETYGEPIGQGAIACDSLACVADSPLGFRLALIKDAGAFHEECGADLIVTRRSAPPTCGAGTVIDQHDLHDGGVHWLRWDAGARRFELRRTLAERDRPWRPPF